VIGRREAYAIAAGILWGFGAPGTWAPVSALAGWAALARSLEGRPVADGLRYLASGAITAALATRWLGPDLVDAGVEHGRWLAAAWVAAASILRGLLGSVVGKAVRRGHAAPLAFGLAEAAWASLAPWVLWLPLDPTLTLGLSPSWLGPAALAGPAGVALTWALAASAPRRHAVWLTGVGLASAWIPWPSSGVPLRVAALQPAIDPSVSDNAETRRALSAAVAALGVQATADVLITPESAWHDPSTPWPDPRPSLVGTPGPGRQSATLWVNGQTVQRVDKYHATPGTERTVLGFGHDRLLAATGPKAVDVAGTRAGVLICGEDLAPGGLAHVLHDNPTWIAILSNDGWGQRSGGAIWHHAAAGRLAASSGRPVVRAALTGPSAIFDARGVALAQRAAGETGWVQASITTRAPAWCGAQTSPWLGLAAAAILFTPSRRRSPAPRSPCEPHPCPKREAG
jgi:apolipoprotein N-acyltransferase